MKTSCTKCQNDLHVEDAVMCRGVCKGIMCFTCAGVKEVIFRKKTTKERAQWSCISCVKQMKLATESNDRTGASFSSKLPTPSLQDIYDLILTVKTDVEYIKKKQDDMEVSLEYISERQAACGSPANNVSQFSLVLLII